MLSLLKKLLKMLLKLPMTLFNMLKKRPLLAGVGLFCLYMCCSEHLMSLVKNVMNADILKKKPEEDDKDAETQQVPEMDDVSMFDESTMHNKMVADVDSKLEDLVNEVHP